MKSAKITASLAVLAFALWVIPNANGQAVPAKQQAAAKGKNPTAAQVAKPGATAVTKASPQTAKPAPPKRTKPAAEKTVKPAVEGAVKPPAEEAAPADNEKAEPMMSRRDPFEPLVNVAQPGSVTHLPPGKAGLVIATVRVDGTVKSPNGMIAVVSNPDERVYFVHEGDRLYDGDVQKISLEGVTFKENSKDAFGKPVERLVTKRIYPSAGEQQ
jgi:hypothetical protein